MLPFIIRESYGGETGAWRWRSGVDLDMFYALVRHTDVERFASLQAQDQPAGLELEDRKGI